MRDTDRRQQISKLRKYMLFIAFAGYVFLVWWIQTNFPVAFNTFLSFKPGWAWWQWALSLIVNYAVMAILVWICAPLIIDRLRSQKSSADTDAK